MRKQRQVRKPSRQIVETLANNVRYLRAELGVSQEELAARCGLHRTYVGSVERGERNVTLSTLEVLASVLAVTAPELLTPLQKADAQRDRSSR